jgi:hypothetical protein
MESYKSKFSEKMFRASPKQQLNASKFIDSISAHIEEMVENEKDLEVLDWMKLASETFDHALNILWDSTSVPESFEEDMIEAKSGIIHELLRKKVIRKKDIGKKK